MFKKRKRKRKRKRKVNNKYNKEQIKYLIRFGRNVISFNF